MPDQTNRTRVHDEEKAHFEECAECGRLRDTRPGEPRVEYVEYGRESMSRKVFCTADCLEAWL